MGCKESDMTKRLSGEGNGTPLQCSCLENPMDGGAWWAAVHGVAKSRTKLSNFTFTFHFHALEKEMATHSSVLAWRIPGTGEPRELPSMGSHRVGHDRSDLAAAAAERLSLHFHDYISLVKIPRTILAESYGKYKFIRSCQAVFQTGCTISPSHHQCMRIPVVPCIYQHLI